VSRLAFSLAGIPFTLTSASRSGIALPETYAPFVHRSTTHSPAAAYRILRAGDTLVSPGADGQVVWDCPTWRMVRTTSRRFCIQLRVVPGEDLLTVAVADPDFSAAEILPRAGRKGAASAHALNYPCDQALIINRLGYFNAGLVHACGVAWQDSALLFSGPSGVGKTTIGRLWRDAGGTLLNDDRMLVRWVSGDVYASATPWHGEEREIRADIHPLGAVYFLRHGEENRIDPLGAAESVAELMANTVAPFYLPDAIERIMDTWSAVLESVPAFRFTFTPDARAVEACRKHVGQSGR
jgi:hypothetical protein